MNFRSLILPLLLISTLATATPPNVINVHVSAIFPPASPSLYRKIQKFTLALTGAYLGAQGIWSLWQPTPASSLSFAAANTVLLTACDTDEDYYKMASYFGYLSFLGCIAHGASSYNRRDILGTALAALSAYWITLSHFCHENRS